MARMTSREFNQDTGRAKKAAERGPVFITDRGRAAHVLLSIEDYNRLARRSGTIADLLAMPGGEDVEFEAPKLGDAALRPAEFD
ncbi:prevent-host-death family protein [Rhizobium azooxidifex]|uniref:Antitoxin n=1 Tax=Mycoplana azooxidifex TaxID=1636188 RepID=A0A7W6DFK9_9HYPH|nr:type II toxin-antitoxin system Phd/YefM family antitoxin [Mycoplana azooxidifex]MBB3978913.1 prevent-host-death family protein [Mycoplana azooxidifex]